MSTVKVAEVNLERGWPTVDEALRELVSRLMTCKGQGYKAVILVHGYGSSGAGGKLGPAVRGKLRESSMSGIVRAVCTGEDWTNKKRELVALCPKLAEQESRIAGNRGVTIVILK